MPYLPTTTTTSVGGILANQPRIDFTGGGCGSLLLEGSRTNVITHSEYIKGIGPTQNMTLLNNASVNPQGLQYATEAVPFQNISTHIFFKSGMGNAANTFTQSIYAKANGYNFCFIRFDLPTTSAWFDLENGVVGQTQSGITSTIVDAGNGWYRCTATLTTTQYANAVIGVSNQDGSTNFAANGTSSVLFWGWQSELGSYPTSYIPTYGTSVTRAKDLCTNSFATASSATLYNSFYSTEVKTLYILDQLLTIAVGENKLAFAFTPTTITISLNGSIVADATGTYDTTALASIQLGNDNGEDYSRSPISGFYVFPSVLTNTELNSLTV